MYDKADDAQMSPPTPVPVLLEANDFNEIVSRLHAMFALVAGEAVGDQDMTSLAESVAGHIPVILSLLTESAGNGNVDESILCHSNASFDSLTTEVSLEVPAVIDATIARGKLVFALRATPGHYITLVAQHPTIRVYDCTMPYDYLARTPCFKLLNIVFVLCMFCMGALALPVLFTAPFAMVQYMGTALPCGSCGRCGRN